MWRRRRRGQRSACQRARANTGAHTDAYTYADPNTDPYAYTNNDLFQHR
jgi:hypothetical protein